MSVSDQTKSAIAFNLTQKKTHTYQGREYYNESEYSSYLVSASEIFANSINPDPLDASNTGIVKKVTLNLYNIYNPTGEYNAYEARISALDALALDGFSNPRLGLPFSDNQRVGFVIPDSYGEDFRPILRDKDNTIIPSGSLSDWFIDFFAGIITHETDGPYLNLNGSDPADDGLATLECYIYIGSFVSDVLSISGSNLYLQDLINGLRSDLDSISGASPWQKFDSGIFYDGAVSGSSFQANNFYGGNYYGNGAGLTNVVDAIVRANLVSVSGSLYQDIEGVETTVAGISAYLLDQISQAQGEVSTALLASVSGALETQINTKLDTSVFVSLSGDLQNQINSIEGEVTTAQLTAISAGLDSRIDDKLSTSTFQALSGYPWDINGNTITYTGDIIGGSFFGDGSGLTGVTGIGIQGPQGISGIQGIQGIQGISGLSIIGPQGVSGTPGTDGTDGASYVPSAIGATSGISAFYGESENFGYLDRDAGLLYFKTSDSYGNFWSPGVPFGKGDQGDAGLDGQDADFLNVNSNIVPTLTNTFSIGTSASSFKSIYLDTITLSGSNEKLLVNNVSVLTAEDYIEERQLELSLQDKINSNNFDIEVRDGIAKEDYIDLFSQTNSETIANGNQYGYAVAVDGDIAVVTSPFDDTNNGGLYIAEKINGTWDSFTRFIPDELDDEFDQFGISVAVDRGKVIVGAPEALTGTGVVYVYEKDLLTQEWGYTELNAISGGPANYGRAVAVYDDTIAVGAPGYLGATGAIVIYKKDDVTDQWLESAVLQDPSPEAFSGFGENIDVYLNKVAVGIPTFDGDNIDSGVAYVFEDNGSGYVSTQIDTISGAFSGAFGSSVSIYKNRLVVGEPDLNQAYLYTFNGTSWVGQILPNDEITNGDNFGNSVAIHDEKIVVGANIGGAGAAYFYNTDDLSVPVKIDIEGDTGDGIGFSVDVSNSDVIIGAPLTDVLGSPNSGRAHLLTVATRLFADYNSIGTDIIPISSNFYDIGSSSLNWRDGYFGNILYINNKPLEEKDGLLFFDKEVITTSSSDFNVFTADGETLESEDSYRYTQVTDISGEPSTIGDGFGEVVSSHANYYAVGSYRQNAETGACSVYVEDFGNFIHTDLEPAGLNTGDQYGYSVDVYSNLVVAGAPGTSFDAGSVYIFERVDGIWQNSEVIVPAGVSAGDQFGYSVSIFGALVAVGAPGVESDTGAVYIFQKLDDVWTEISQIQVVGLPIGSLFGTKVSVYNDTLSVYTPDGNGQVYIFDEDNSAWSQTAIFENDTGPSDEEYGRSLSLNGNTLAVGTAAEYMVVYSRTSGLWDDGTILVSSDNQSGDLFGYEVSVEGSVLLVSSPEADSGDGKLYTYQKISGIWGNENIIADESSHEGFGYSISINRINFITSFGYDVANAGKVVIYEAQRDLKVADGGIGRVQLDTEVNSILDNVKWTYDGLSSISYNGAISGGVFYGDGSQLTGLDRFATTAFVGEVSGNVISQLGESITTKQIFIGEGGDKGNIRFNSFNEKLQFSHDLVEWYDFGTGTGDITSGEQLQGAAGLAGTIQINNAGSLAGDPAFRWDTFSKTLTISGNLDLADTYKGQWRTELDVPTTQQVTDLQNAIVDTERLRGDGLTIKNDSLNITPDNETIEISGARYNEAGGSIAQLLDSDDGWGLGSSSAIGLQPHFVSDGKVAKNSSGAFNITLSHEISGSGNLFYLSFGIGTDATAETYSTPSSNLFDGIVSNLTVNLVNVGTVWVGDSYEEIWKLDLTSGYDDLFLNELNFNYGGGAYYVRFWESDPRFGGKLRVKNDGIDSIHVSEELVDTIGGDGLTRVGKTLSVSTDYPTFTDISDNYSTTTEVGQLSAQVLQDVSDTYITTTAVADLTSSLPLENVLDTGVNSVLIGDVDTNTADVNTGIAVGAGAQALHDNTFVWSDGTPFGSTFNKTFNIYAQNGVNISGGNITVNGLALAVSGANQTVIVQGTPNAGEVTFWAGSNQIDSDGNLTWDGSDLTVSGTKFSDKLDTSIFAALSGGGDVGTALLSSISGDLQGQLDLLPNTYLPLTGGDLTGNLTVAGDLVVNGTTTTVNSEEVLIEDNILTLNSSLSGSPAPFLESGIKVNRGTEDPYFFLFRESDLTFTIGVSGAISGSQMQAVATREDIMGDNNLVYWDADSNIFRDSGISYTAVTDGIGDVTSAQLSGISGLLEDQITSVQTQVDGLTGGTLLKIDSEDSTAGFFTDKVKAGTNITFTTSPSAGAGDKELFISANFDPNGVFGSKEIPLNDKTIRVDYPEVLLEAGTPIISLVIPISGDFLQVTGIYNSNTDGFNVQLSGPVRSVGYKINWTLNTSSQFDLSNVGQSIVPSADNLYDLGAPDKKWRSLYVSENTIYIGSESISVVDSISGGESQISFSGNEIAVFNQDGALPLTAIPAELQSGLSFQDMIDPNTTQLPNVSGYGIGNFFIASDTGTLTDNISASFSVSEGDWAINKGDTWRKMPFKLPVRGITSVQIKEGAIRDDNIFPAAVTSSKIRTGAVTVDKVDPSVFNLTNITTTEMDINKVLRPDGEGGFSFGNVNLDVDAVANRVTALEAQGGGGGGGAGTGLVAAISGNLQAQIDNKADSIGGIFTATKDISSSSYTVTPGDISKILFFTHEASDVILNLPDNLANPLSLTIVKDNPSVYGVILTTTGTSILKAKGGGVSVVDANDGATIIHKGSGVWHAFGDLI